MNTTKLTSKEEIYSKTKIELERRQGANKKKGGNIFHRSKLGTPYA